MKEVCPENMVSLHPIGMRKPEMSGLSLTFLQAMTGDLKRVTHTTPATKGEDQAGARLTERTHIPARKRRSIP